MKLFENGVGRPSNEIKKKRKIFIASIVSIILFIFIGSFLLFKNNIINLQGNSSKYAVTIQKKDYTKITFSVKQPKDGIVYIDAYSYIKDSGYESLKSYVESANVSVKANKEKKVTVYYLPSGYSYKMVVTFKDNEYNELYKKTIYVNTPTKKPGGISIKKTDNSVSLGDIYFNVPHSERDKGKNSGASPDKVLIYRSTSKNGNFKMVGEVTSTTTVGWDIDGSFNFVYSYTDKNLASGTTYYYKVRGWYEKGNYIEKSFYGPYSSVKKVKTSGKKVATTTNKITLSCPGSANIGKEFKCTTNQTGVTITVGGAKALASGYSSSFKTTSNDKGKSIKYTDKLFASYKSQIKKDSNGKEYINAKIVAKKNGYKSVTKNVKIYKGTVSSNNSEKVQSDAMTLTCPGSASVNEAFKCYTNKTGVTITVGGAKALASGYSSSFTTTSSDLTKDIKYTNTLFNGSWSIKKDNNKKEYVNAIITAKKSGYKTVKKKVKIYKGTVSSNNSENAQSDVITLTCPSSAKVGQAVKCYTNKTGVTITVGGAKALASGYSSSFTTTSSDLTKDIKYTNTLFNGSWSIKKDNNKKEYVNAIITAKKSGYKTVTKYIKIYR